MKASHLVALCLVPGLSAAADAGASNDPAAAAREAYLRLAGQAAAENSKLYEGRKSVDTTPDDRGERARDRKLAVPAISAIICHNIEVRAAMKREIEEEYRSARVSGGEVVDLSSIHENQEGMKLGQQVNGSWLRMLGAMRSKPIPCGKRLDSMLDFDVQHIMPNMTDGTYATLDDAPWFSS